MMRASSQGPRVVGVGAMFFLFFLFPFPLAYWWTVSEHLCPDGGLALHCNRIPSKVGLAQRLPYYHVHR